MGNYFNWKSLLPSITMTTIAVGLVFNNPVNQRVNAQQAKSQGYQIYVDVPAAAGCVNSGIDVSSGNIVKFSAFGEATYGPEKEFASEPITDANGNRSVNGVDLGTKIDPHAIYPGPIGALVGKVGSTGNYFFMGLGGQLDITQSGTLFLCYNDEPNSFYDNKGGYTVSVDVLSE
ncbi:MAG: hypothetical protein DSM106950_16835 [Stigonema ocellatum SAG 48.90 = DSM 106950]|nr:hypothetical protein [Stigonema ocellatum SAG 48.90 = DSM 106950]